MSGVFFDPSAILPAISITNPGANSVFVSPIDVPLQADAVSDTNNVRRVEFYDGTTLLGVVTNGPPFSLVWTNAGTGSHVVLAREIGVAGTAESSAVSIRVVSSSDLVLVSARLLSTGSLVLDALVPPGTAVRLDAISKIGPDAAWMPIATNTSGSNRIQFLLNDPANYPQRWYRLKALP